MNTQCSNANDCHELSMFLNNELSNIYFNENTKKKKITGKIYLKDKFLLFSCEFCRNEFLKIEIKPRYPKINSMNEKLEALSNLYLTIRTKYGEPNVFYTLKNDEDDGISLYWSFNNKNIENFLNGNEENIETLIEIGRLTNEKIIENGGLPYELLILKTPNDYSKKNETPKSLQKIKKLS